MMNPLAKTILKLLIQRSTLNTSGENWYFICCNKFFLVYEYYLFFNLLFLHTILGYKITFNVGYSPVHFSGDGKNYTRLRFSGEFVKKNAQMNTCLKKL